MKANQLVVTMAIADGALSVAGNVNIIRAPSSGLTAARENRRRDGSL